MKAIEIVYRYGSEAAAPRELPRDAGAARERLSAGNRAFAQSLADLRDAPQPARRVIDVDARDLGLAGTGAPAQRPFAAILGCADARVPVELLFGEGPNDLFVVRVAGNGLGNEILASLRYAVENLGGSLKLIAVLGHSGCGAVTAAVDVFLEPASYLELAPKHLLRNLLDRLVIVVHASARSMAQALGPDVARRPGYRAALVEVAAVANAALAAYTLRQQLAELAPGGVEAAYGVYVLEAREVWNPHGTGLAAAPASMAELAALGESASRSQRVAALLDRTR
jgi:carbonic anhydrase